MRFRFFTFKWRFQFSLFALLGVVTIVAIVLGIAPTVRVQLALRALSNKDVEVDGTPFGLMVDVQSSAAEQLKSFGSRANWALERALDDPERFAAAHILLTEINESQVSSFGSASHWNDMRITLHAGGSVNFHAEQISQLQEHWRNRLGKDRPASE